MRLPSPPIPWYLRPLLAWQRRRHGHVLEPTAMWAWRPAPMLGFLTLFSLLRRRASPVPARLRALASVRVSQVVDCAFCVDLNAALFLRDGDASELADLPGWRDAARYTNTERLVGIRRSDVGDAADGVRWIDVAVPGCLPAIRHR